MTSIPQGIPLVVQGATKRFGQVTALAGVSLEVRRGELLGLLGPNGAGKTTMIKAVSGRLRLDAGAIQVFGRTLAREDRRPEIGVVPQEIALYDKLTARENLEVFGRLAGVTSGLDQRVSWALDWADLGDRANQPIKAFSGGMKRRLNIAASLLHQPSLVLLDEPTAGVDPQSRERIYEMLAQLREKGVSIVLTTHHLEEAETRCDRIVIIDHGRVVASGTVRELLTQTLGAGRALVVELLEPLPPGINAPAGMTADDERRTLRASVEDVGRDVPAYLAELARSGARIKDLELTGVSLQDAFIALTGRELRE